MSKSLFANSMCALDIIKMKKLNFLKHAGYLLSMFLMLSAEIAYSQEFVQRPLTNFSRTYGSSDQFSAFGDVDGDLDPDLIITGPDGSGEGIAHLFINNGNGNFERDTETTFTGVANGSVAFADIDGDNDQDVLITGRDDSGTMTARMYLNDGSGSFTFDTSFTGVDFSSVSFADIDGDDDLDLLITGQTQTGAASSILYSNDGTGTFSEIAGTPLRGVSSSAVEFADIDGDDDLDLIISGALTGGLTVTDLFTNDGSGNFTKVNSTPFDAGLRSGDVEFEDVDGDNDLDLMMSGSRFSGTPGVFNKATELYINNGSGDFTLGTSFTGLDRSSLDFSDVNGDTYPDLLITGQEGSSISIRTTELYLNNGSGVFTEETDIPFEGIELGEAIFQDINGDSDEDLFLIGFSANFGTFAGLYINVRNYTSPPSITSPLAITIEESVSGIIQLTEADRFATFSLGTSKDESGFFISFPNKLTLISSPNFELPTDGNSDNVYVLDLIATDLAGQQNTQEITVTVTDINDAPRTAFQIADQVPVESFGTLEIDLSTVFFDEDGDELIYDITVDDESVVTAEVVTDPVTEDSKILIKEQGLLTSTTVTITAEDEGGESATDEFIVFVAPRSRFFKAEAPFTPVLGGSSALEDVNGDSHLDAFITGLTQSGTIIASLYLGDGEGNFTEVSGTSFTGIANGDVEFADFDGDNDPDLLISGNFENTILSPSTKLYLNDGSGVFTETSTSLMELSASKVAVADVDGDDDLDILLTGWSVAPGDVLNEESILYLNDGNGSFTEDNTVSFRGVVNGWVEFADVDGDEDPDALFSGSFDGIGIRTLLFKNNGSGGFTEVGGAFSEGYLNSSFDFADVDNDDDLDLIILGSSNFSSLNTDLYLNDGQGVFSKAISPFTQMRYGTVNFSDLDLDGDEDVIITGSDLASGVRAFTGVYYNDGNGFFGVSPNNRPTPVQTSAISIADVDGDSFPDVLVTGNDGSFQRTANLFLQDRQAPTFTSPASVDFEENSTEVAYEISIEDNIVSTIFTYALGESKDESSFILDNRNEIKFAEAPDFENPMDANADNSYEVDVMVTDQYLNTGMISVTINVTNVVEPGDNNAPELAIPIDDLSLTEGFSLEELDLSANFTDADEDVLILTAELSGDDVVAINVVQNTVLEIGEVGVGQVQVTVTANDGEGGTATDSFQITVTEAPNNAPTVANPLSNQTLNAGFGTSDIDLTGVFADADADELTYSADVSGSSITVSVSGSTLTLTESGLGSSEVSVTANDGNGGTAENTFSVIVSQPLGVSANDFNQLSIYPNPITEGKLTIDFNEFVEGQLSVINLKGKVVQARQVKGNVTRLDFSNQSNGIYLIQINSDKGEASIRVVKK